MPAGTSGLGQYARRQMAGRAAGVPGGVAWLPTTIPAGTIPAARPALAEALDTALPVISLYGYAAPWKDAGLLLAALGSMRAPARIVLAGDFWDDPGQAGLDLSAFTRGPARAGRGELAVVPGYLSPADRAALVRASAAGVFPYRPHASFQGSGAIADYLARAVPVIATGVANMAELAGGAGTIVPPGDPQALAAALDAIASGSETAVSLARQAAAQARRFTAEVHAARCLTVYQQAAGRSMRRKERCRRILGWLARSLSRPSTIRGHPDARLRERIPTAEGASQRFRRTQGSSYPIKAEEPSVHIKDPSVQLNSWDSGGRRSFQRKNNV
jgi:hypothetical protein